MRAAGRVADPPALPSETGRCPRSQTAAAAWWSSPERMSAGRSSSGRIASRSTSSSPCSTGPSARTARSRASSSSPAFRTSARASSAQLGMDKDVQKRLFARRGSRSVRTKPRDRLGRRSRDDRGGREALGYPFTKPATLGSSVGIEGARHRGARRRPRGGVPREDALVEKAAEGARRSNAPSSGTTIRSRPSRARSFRSTTSSTTTRRSTSTSTGRGS